MSTREHHQPAASLRTTDSKERLPKSYAPAHDGDIMVVDEVAAYLRMSRRWVYGAVARGEIPAGRFGRYLRFETAKVMRYADAAFAATAR